LEQPQTLIKGAGIRGGLMKPEFSLVQGVLYSAAPCFAILKTSEAFPKTEVLGKPPLERAFNALLT
jgi:hypothetical protein